MLLNTYSFGLRLSMHSPFPINCRDLAYFDASVSILWNPSTPFI